MAAFGGMSFSLYRVVHQSHHAHLATERDEEAWPFVHPGVSRPARILAAILELGLECFTRRSCSSAHLSGRDRRFEKRTCAGASGRSSAWRYACGLSFWEPSPGSEFGNTSSGLLAPAWLAANMQSLRKYIEHVGLMGSTVNSSTRSIVAHGWLGKLVAFTLLHEPFHGVHHRHSGLSHAKLPQFAILEPARPDERPPFPSYWQAFQDLSFRAWQILASVRSGTSPNPSAGSIWRRLAKEAGAASIQPGFGHEFFIARWRGRQAARLRGGRSEEGISTMGRCKRCVE